MAFFTEHECRVYFTSFWVICQRSTCTLCLVDFQVDVESLVLTGVAGELKPIPAGFGERRPELVASQLQSNSLACFKSRLRFTPQPLRKNRNFETCI